MAVLTAERADCRDLARLAAAGDREAFGDLYEATRDQVYGYVLRLVSYDRPVAEDITQAAYLRALGRIEAWEDTGTQPVAWLMTISRNLVLDRAKSAPVRRCSPTGDVAALDSAQWGSDPAEHVLGAELAAVVRAALGRLNPDYCQCLTLRFLDGLTSTETAAIMGKPLGALKAMQHRACRALARQMPDGFSPP